MHCVEHVAPTASLGEERGRGAVSTVRTSGMVRGAGLCAQCLEERRAYRLARN